MPKPIKAGTFRMTAKDGEGEIILYDVIDSFWGVSAKKFRDDLKALGDVSKISLRLNSEGGSVFEAFAIYNTLKAHPATVTVHVDGMALSAASMVAMAGDEIEMAKNAFMMIHDPIGGVYGGDAEEMRQMAELLDKLKGAIVDTYVARTKMDAATIAQMMLDETWMDAAEAVEKGFADRTTAALKVAASFDRSRFRHVPEAFNLQSSKEPTMAESKTTAGIEPASFEDLKAAFPKADAAFLVAQLEARATLQQATAAYQSALEAKAEAAEKKAADLQAKADQLAKNAGTAGGVAPVKTVTDGGAASDSGDDSDPIAKWDALVAANEAKGCKRPKAIAKAAKEHPEDHRAYIVAYNQAHGRKIE